MHGQTQEMGNWRLGFDALLDLQYAYYFSRKAESKVAHGILTGVSVGYASSPLKNNINIDTTFYKGSADEMVYKVTADKVSETDGQIQIEVPLMYSLLTDKGFFFNIGPRFMMPVYRHFNETVSDDLNVEAKFTDFGVTVTNEEVLGLLQDKSKKDSWAKGKTIINVMISAELGWEWKMKSGNALGLGLYANYSPLNTYSNNTSNNQIITITPPDASGKGSAALESATDSYVSKMNYFDGGLKLIYHFNFPKQFKQ